MIPTALWTGQQHQDAWQPCLCSPIGQLTKIAEGPRPDPVFKILDETPNIIAKRSVNDALLYIRAEQRVHIEISQFTSGWSVIASDPHIGLSLHISRRSRTCSDIIHRKLVFTSYLLPLPSALMSCHPPFSPSSAWSSTSCPIALY